MASTMFSHYLCYNHCHEKERAKGGEGKSQKKKKKHERVKLKSSTTIRATVNRKKKLLMHSVWCVPKDLRLHAIIVLWLFLSLLLPL